MTSTTVAEYMIKDVVSVSPDMTVAEVSEKMIDSNFHGFSIAQPFSIFKKIGVFPENFIGMTK